MSRLLLVLTVLAALSTSACAQLRSDLRVPPGEQFELDGTDAGAYTVAARNVGPVPVAVVERSRDGRRTPRGTLATGAATRLRLAPGSTVVVVNRSAREARLDVRVTGDTDLGMGYVAAEAAAEAAAAPVDVPK